MEQFLRFDNKTIGRHIPYLLILVTLLPLLLFKLDIFPQPWFDEGYSTHAARALVEQGIYGTIEADRILPLDPGISTGPTVILPLALNRLLMGSGVYEGRLVIVAFSILGILALYRMGVYLYGQQTGLIAALAILAFPAVDHVSYLLISRQILGEIPGIALIMSGLLLWFHSWNHKNWHWELAAGVLIGLGVIAKIQLAVGIMPAIFIVTMLRQYRQGPRQWVRASVPVLMAGSTILIWLMIQRLAVPAGLRAEYAITFAEAGRAHFLTPNLGRFLTTQGFVLVGIAALAAVTGTWRLVSYYRKNGSLSETHWAEMTLLLAILIATIWFVLLSVGWSRYMTFTLVLSLLVLGKTFWDAITTWTPAPAHHTLLNTGAVSILLVFTLVSNLSIIESSAQDSGLSQMAQFIDEQVPQNAVIESWSWEVDALTSHWMYHHPHQRDLYTAIRQQFHEKRDFHIVYPLSVINPDYLLTNEFSDWTQIYDRTLIQSDFRLIAEFGQYSLYARVSAQIAGR